METIGYRLLDRGYRLFAMPSWLSGAARALDLGGTFNAYNVSKTGAEADCRALESDWVRVGDDLREVLIVAVGKLDPARAADLRARVEKISVGEGQQLRLMDV